VADDKISSNGRVDIWAVPATGIADYRSPTAAEVNAGVRLTPAIAWDGTTFPANDESSDIDDRSLEDVGNATTRGFASFTAELAFFRPVPGDTTSEAAVAWNLLKTPRVPIYLVTRVLQRTGAPGFTAATAGDWVSVYRFITDTVNDDTEGEDSVKFIVGFSPQGLVAPYTQIKNATPPTVTNASGSGSVAAGGYVVLRATLGGKPATQTVNWSSSNPAVARVSNNGVVTAVSAGTANITASHPAATGSSTPVAITVT
jgi:uncharacterized protein YjdB